LSSGFFRFLQNGGISIAAVSILTKFACYGTIIHVAAEPLRSSVIAVTSPSLRNGGMRMDKLSLSDILALISVVISIIELVAQLRENSKKK
jgi:hypothetical protein